MDHTLYSKSHSRVKVLLKDMGFSCFERSIDNRELVTVTNMVFGREAEGLLRELRFEGFFPDSGAF